MIASVSDHCEQNARRGGNHNGNQPWLSARKNERKDAKRRAERNVQKQVGDVERGCGREGP